MKAKDMPKRFWGEAASTTVYILNRYPNEEGNQEDTLEGLDRIEAKC